MRRCCVSTPQSIRASSKGAATLPYSISSLGREIGKGSTLHTANRSTTSALGRLRSSSYAPRPGALGYSEMEADFKRLFAETAVEGKVSFLYDTHVYLGELVGLAGE